VTHKADSPFAEHIDLIIGDSVVFRMLWHREAESLAHHIVERHCEEVSTKEQEAKSIYAIKLTPLGFLFKHLIDLDSLASFTNLNG